jgi:hypothetical protein
MIVDNIRERTLNELIIDYDNNVDKFLNNLNDRIEIGKYINNKYGYTFNPIDLDYLNKQKEILNNLNTDLTENKEKFDIINKAPHYNTGKYECIDVMREVFGDEKLKIWCILNAFKYLYRCYYKNGDQDLKKATYYLNYINNNLIDKEKDN